MKNDSIAPGMRPTTKSTAISGRNTPRPNARMRNVTRRPTPPATTPAANRYQGSRRMNARRLFHPSATRGLRRGVRLNLCPQGVLTTNPLFSPRRVVADAPRLKAHSAPLGRAGPRTKPPHLLGNSGKYPFARDVGYVGTGMSAERQKIRAAEWLYRWNLSMSILGIVFTILTFVGVFTLVLHQYFAEFGLDEAEVLLVLLAVVLVIIFGFGFYLDKFLRFWSAQTTVATVRNQFLTSALYQKELLIMKYSQIPQMEGLLHLIE